ncbi:alkaline phosphatase [Nocardioides exalbidus]|uniref:Alkaline phosphatase n=1 Tax=Nocardioides exalbidus TaxID=402596 RepID=A0A1H4TVV3_9ACTN|nr:alkaline phosphatase [Nocardioides exalbidus]SEC60602.1 alkaline phosphatase [Nocardioides exalbidus]
MKRLSVPAIAAGTAAVVALGIAAASAVPMGFTQDRSADLAQQINPARPKSVILLIGDGMDDSMITAARNYSKGASGRLVLDELPFTGAMTTYGLKVGAGPKYPIAYVSDSAPTASGWSTGKKTVDGRISQGPSTADTVPGENYQTVLEKFKAMGKLTGDVSTAEITDATPAAAASHINARACQDPSVMTNCQAALKSQNGLGSIAEQLVDNKVDVLLGGGQNRYAKTLEGSSTTVLDYARNTRGYRSVTTASELAGVTSLSGGPVLGLFSPGNMTRKYAPRLAVNGGTSDTGPCVEQSRGTQPTLAAMTTEAISLLDNPNGFFLQVEGASVDKAEHERDICGAIGELEELDLAVKAALDYQKAHPDTLVIVTGDHAHSTQIVMDNFGGSATATVTTADGDPMTVAYSSSYAGTPPQQATHTGSQIRVAAIGPQAANVTGVIDQTDLFNTMMGRTPSTLPTQPTATATTTVTTTPSPTTPAPTSTPTSTPVEEPTIWLASPKKVARGSETWISVTVDGATSVKVKIKQGKDVVVRELSRKGGSVKLPRLDRGSAQIKVIAVGAGGRTEVKRTLTVR